MAGSLRAEATPQIKAAALATRASQAIHRRGVMLVRPLLSISGAWHRRPPAVLEGRVTEAAWAQSTDAP